MSSKTSSATKSKGKAAPKSAAAEKRAARQGKSLSFNDIRLSEKQLAFYRLIMENDITVGTGPAGSSKTFTACYAALKLLEKGLIEKIYLTKPIQESGEKLGFLPGDIGEKIDPYMESYLTNMNEIADSFDIGNLIADNKIVFKPLAYMRGSGYHNCVMILDEAQNCDCRQLMLYTTRMGRNTKIIITGDVSQHDIDLKKVALPFFAEKILGGNSVDGIGVHTYSKEDIVRNPLLIGITDRYEELKANGQIPSSK